MYCNLSLIIIQTRLINNLNEDLPQRHNTAATLFLSRSKLHLGFQFRNKRCKTLARLGASYSMATSKVILVSDRNDFEYNLNFALR